MIMEFTVSTNECPCENTLLSDADNSQLVNDDPAGCGRKSYSTTVDRIAKVGPDDLSSFGTTSYVFFI